MPPAQVEWLSTGGGKPTFPTEQTSAMSIANRGSAPVKAACRGCSVKETMGRHQRAQRALTRQLAYQRKKAAAIRGQERDIVLAMMHSSSRVRTLLKSYHPITPDVRVLEVGSGAQGLIFFFGVERGVGVDPLAQSYAKLFPEWQSRVTTVAAFGESLPFAQSSFDIVLCDNVVDHAESPGASCPRWRAC